MPNDCSWRSAAARRSAAKLGCEPYWLARPRRRAADSAGLSSRGRIHAARPATAAAKLRPIGWARRGAGGGRANWRVTELLMIDFLKVRENPYGRSIGLTLNAANAEFGDLPCVPRMNRSRWS